MKNSTPLDWSALVSGSERVFYFGDYHTDDLYKEELIAHLSELKRAGITHLAFECLTADMQFENFPSDSQGRYELFERLREVWKWDAIGYFKLIEAASLAGFKIVALDMDFDSKVALGGSGRQAARRQFDQRDRFGANRISNILMSDKNARIFALIGRNHIEPGKQPDILEEQFGWKSKRFFLASSFLQYGKLRRALRNHQLFFQSFLSPLPSGLKGSMVWINKPNRQFVKSASLAEICARLLAEDNFGDGLLEQQEFD